MEVNELIKALRCCGNTDYKEPDCDNCPLRGRMCVKRMLESAADTLEELQAQLDKAKEERDVAREFACTHCSTIPCVQSDCPCWGGPRKEDTENG